MKYELKYLDGCGDFSEMQSELWALQRQTREILNKTIQIAFNWDYKSIENHKKTEEYLDVKKKTGKSLEGYIYKEIMVRDYPNFAGGNLSATVRKAFGKYKSSKKDILSGKMSLPSYKRDQPLIIRADCIRIIDNNKNGAIADITFLSIKRKEEKGLKKTGENVRFEIKINDNTQRNILNNILSGKYGLGQSQLVYKRPKWFLYITYNFAPEYYDIDPDKILGVDLGETIAIYASSINEYGSFRIEGGEITAFAKKNEARKRSMQKQAAHCGEGRIGHGTKTRVADVYKLGNKIANFRDTINHRYSRALIEYALKNHYGTIQMEDLSGIKKNTEFPKFLQHWTYYDLQSKIENKAAEYGIKVVKIKPDYTSQRCSECGNIDKANRPSQSKFCCTECGFSCNADLNAAKNISIKNIEKIIKKEMDAKSKET